MAMASVNEALTVSVAGQSIALSSGIVTEILRPTPVTRVPLGPPGLLGVANLRGQVVPIISLAVLLGAPPGHVTPQTRIVIVDIGTVYGLQVDAVLVFGSPPAAGIMDIGTLLAPLFADTVGPSADAARPSAAARPAHRPAQPAAAADPAQDDITLVALCLAGQEYALRLEDVAEIIALPAITAVPRTDPAMLGVIDSRVGLLPLLSLRALLALPLEGFDPTKARIVVTRIAGHMVGLVSDEVTAILRLPQDAIEPVPAVLTRGTGESQIEAICRLEGGRRLVGLLSTEHLLDAPTIERLASSAKSQTNASAIAADHAETGQFVIVRVGGNEYGMPVDVVAEVARHPGSLTRVPYAPSFVEGAMNLRGRIIPVIDQHQRFGGAADTATPTSDRRVVIIGVGSLQAGFAVDAASEILTISRTELKPAPAINSAGAKIFDHIATFQSERRMIPIVNPKVLLDEAERDLLAAFVAKASAAS
jgi:purine-binding chemotaxis protein CheW